MAQDPGLATQPQGAAAGTDVDAVINDRPITGKVIQGADAERGTWPSVLAIVSTGPASLSDRFFCGGTLVAERWVLTAAHCMFSTLDRLVAPSTIRVVAGIHDLVEDDPADEVVVTNVIIHPDYDNGHSLPQNDIALLELGSTIDAPLSELFIDESEYYSDIPAYIVGWGATRYVDDRGVDFPAIQQEAVVPLVGLAVCNSVLSYQGLLAPTQLCAGYVEGGVDTCSGDSGGPLYIIENGQPVQIGITSFGNGCAQANFYGIYTNVSHYISWLGNYVSVPEQSAEFLAFRDAALNSWRAGDGYNLNGDSGGDSGFFGGATSPWLFLVLVAFVVNACSGKSILQISVQQDRTGPDDDLVTDLMTGLERAPMQLSVTDNTSRAGLEGLSLGDERESIMSWLNSHTRPGWQKPACTTDKTALRGAGRLFLLEKCSVQVEVQTLLAGQGVRRLDLVLLDQQLVRLDVLWSDELIRRGHESSNLRAGGVVLRQLLDDRFGRPVQPDEWRQADDRIRLLPDMALQFIDGRLIDRLPGLDDSTPSLD